MQTCTFPFFYAWIIMERAEMKGDGKWKEKNCWIFW